MIALACSMASAATASAQSFTRLGYLPDGTQTTRLSVSADGHVVTGYSISPIGQRAVRWTASGGLQDLGILTSGDIGSRGDAINGDGSIIVGISNPSGIFRWTSGAGMTSFDNFEIIPTAMSDDGTVVVGYGSSSPGGYTHAFRWRSCGGTQDLGTAIPFGVSHDGEVVIGVSGTRAFRWTSGGGMVGMGSGFLNSRANGVSGNGLVVVGSVGDDNEAWKWTANGTGTYLGSLPNPIDGHEYALAASFDGSVIVGASGGSAFLWTAALGMVDLNTYLPTIGIPLPSGFWLTSATDISADGKTIVGGNGEGWVVHLTQIPAPSPRCRADFNGLDGVSIDDLFQFFDAWFRSDPRADFNGLECVTIDDLFLYLNAWFVGC